MGKLRTIRANLRKRGVQVQGGVHVGNYILIKKNETKLGKRYIVEWHKNGKLMATQPVNYLDDIERKYFNF